MDRFDAMRAFARVVEAGSFTKAAQTLHMSKTTVTQLIQQLEARLGVRLFDRSQTPLALTPAGEIYVRQAKEILRIRSLMESMLSEATGQDVEKVSRDIERDKYLTAEEAVEYGIVDRVLTDREL